MEIPSNGFTLPVLIVDCDDNNNNCADDEIQIIQTMSDGQLLRHRLKIRFDGK